MNRRTTQVRASKRTREASDASLSSTSETTDTAEEGELTPTPASRSELTSDTSSRNAIPALSDTVCIIYTYLEQRDQGSLRQTCLTAAERFDQTVDMGDVPAVGSNDIAVWESRRLTAYDRDEESPGSSRHRWQWFPIAHRCLGRVKGIIEVLQVNIDVIALNPTYRTEWGMEMTSNAAAVASCNFLAHLAAVRRVFFRESKLLEAVGSCFLRDCRQLLAVDFHGLGSLTTVAYGWLCQCSSLTTISFEGLSALSTVEEDWLSECTSLTTISFEGLSALTTVGNFWLDGCTSLTTISFEALSALIAVDSFWLEGCTSLTTISFEGLGALTTVGWCWLSGCASLSRVSFDSSSSTSSFLQKLKDRNLPPNVMHDTTQRLFLV